MGPPRVTLAPRRQAPFLGGHPWVFSGAVASVAGEPADGDEVDVVASDGTFVARGLYNGRSQIRVRLYRREPAPLDAAFLSQRIREAVRLRERVLGLDDPAGACRLVFSEGDGLSGLTVDRYGPYLSVQFTSLALATRREALLDALEEAVTPRGMVLRTEKGILEEEGLELRDGVLRGAVPEEPFEIRDGGLRFAVDLRTGQKTGFYLDQRENRARAASYARGRAAADVCCYTGGFTVALAAAGAASVTGVDASAPALALAASNAERNGVGALTRFQRGDAFRWLQGEAEAGRTYDMIVLDPPRFARTRTGVRQAVQAYERLNRLAISRLRPDGILVTCSCSGRVTLDEFTGAVARGAAAERRTVQILEARGQAPDHPVAASCPESAYLKCLICRVA
ncbi:MAG TPA: class I SAM-dependent rRNA methyltransferase [Longimicrobiales bacterium]|nr:class I SAM-dependent rRNA methyltransferase [Longimicrobiales bacterium]